MDACPFASSSSSSSSSSLPTSEKYDVFLSFRGEDTRDKFTSHLYAALDGKKIKTYIDEVSLERGDEISPALLEAIQKSKISVIVFSKNYAFSSWCLSELVHTLECRRENNQIVIPIFYEVDPSHIRWQKGSYGEAFLKHEERLHDKMETVQKWRDALTESANISGHDSQKLRPESKLVEVIVEDVLKKLDRGQSSNSDFGGFIGIHRQIAAIKSLLSVTSPKVRIVGIWGMGGIGKTTLAQVVYDQLSSQFEAHCFVRNVREESQKGSLINLRDKLLADLLKEENLNVGTPSLGSTFVTKRLQRTKVFIVLDDVNHVEQFRTFVGDRGWFSCESRIVITTRDASLLRAISADGMYEVTQLSSEESLQLFNSKAFAGNSPVTDYTELSKEVVRHTGGVPLAITVLGSHFRSLRSQTKEAWEAALDKLKAVPHDDVHNVLRVSFDGLDNMEKDIFLDIACFFKGMSRKYVENVLNGCGFHATTGIDALIDKSLITIKYDELWMHDLLEEMGRKIVRQESKVVGKHSRLWIAKDARKVLQHNEGTKKIQGIFLDLSKIGRDIHLGPTVFEKMHNLRLLKIYDSHFRYFLHPHRDLKWHGHPTNYKVCLRNGLQFLPYSLRYLEWQIYPSKTLPPDFEPNNLVELKMTHSLLEKLWDGVQDLENLRRIDLRHSIHLNQIPDLSLAPNLETINLKGCTSLRLDPSHSIWNLPKLTDVDLSYCSELRGFADRIVSTSLRTLSLQGCSNINTFPITMAATSLVSLNLSSTAIESLPSSIGSLNSLSELWLKDCTRLANLPSSLNKLDSLTLLSLGGCSILEKFPELPCNIEELDIYGTAIKEVTSSSIEGRFRLWRIDLSDSKSLESLPTDFFRLRCLTDLVLRGCSKLQKLPEILGIKLTELDVDGCEKLESIQSSNKDMASLYKPNLSSHVQHLRLDNSNIIEIPKSIIGMSYLRELYTRNCKNLRSLPELPARLQRLDASGCVSLEEVSYSWPARTQMFSPVVEDYTFSLFFNCLKLDKKAEEKIMTDFQIKVLGASSKPKESKFVQACFPGNEVPNLFDYQSEGSSINLKFQQQCHNLNYLGFIACAVCEFFPHTGDFKLYTGINLKYNQGKKYRFARSTPFFCFGNLTPKPNSNHVFMWYLSGYHDVRYWAVEAEEFSFDFSLIESSKGRVKKCGIRMLYRNESDFRVRNLLLPEESDEIPDQPESSACVTINFDTDEPHPKRTKL